MTKQTYFSIAVLAITVFLIGCTTQETDEYEIYGNYILDEMKYKVLRDATTPGVTLKKGTEVSYQPPLVSGELELSLSGRFSLIITFDALIASLGDLSTISNRGRYIIDANRIKLLGENGEEWFYFEFINDKLTLTNTVDDSQITFVFQK